MGTLTKIRNLGQYGIIADRDPYDLPPEAWSGGANIRFRNGRVSRSPIWKPIFRLAADTTGPQCVFSDVFSSGTDDIFIGYPDGRIIKTSASLETDVSISGFQPLDPPGQDLPWSGIHLANVFYMNRSDRDPWYYTEANEAFAPVPWWGMIKTATPFTATVTNGSASVTAVAYTAIPGYTALANGMDVQAYSPAGVPLLPTGTTISAYTAGGTTFTLSNPVTLPTGVSGTGITMVAGTQQKWQAALLRTVGGALVGLNMTINGTSSPTMVVTSSLAESNSPPSSWDYATINTDATQNILAEIEGGILDACPLGNNLVIYGYNSSWLMAPSLGTEIFDYSKLPYSRGAINANCSVEIDGKNYVFGPDDIWVHDGTSEKSLINDRNRDYVFSNLDFHNTKRCFVGYNPALREIYFCYPTLDQTAYFNNGGVKGCNRAAVYNWMDDNWSFDDLPNVYGSGYANTDVSATWESLADTVTWTNIGGSWNSQDTNEQRTVIFVGQKVTDPAKGTNPYGILDTLYAYDLWGLGSTAAFFVDVNATAPAHLERDGIDLDQVQGVNLPDYKLFSSLFPLARLDPSPNTTLDIKFGTSDYYGTPAIFDGIDQTYDGGQLYKLDYNMAGRFAAMKVTWNDYTTFSISGFDFLIDETGQR